MQTGRILALFIAPEQSSAMIAVEEVKTLAGQGLQGDRYATNAGTFKKRGTNTNATNATFIEAEALESLQREHGITLTPESTRRNILTRGIALNHLVGQEFTVGKTRFRGIELCEPCSHLERSTLAIEANRNDAHNNNHDHNAVRKGLVGRGGLRAEILSDSIIRIGEMISVPLSNSVPSDLSATASESPHITPTPAHNAVSI